MCFHVNVFLCGFSDFLLEQPHMGIEDIYVVSLLNALSCVFSDLLLQQPHMSIEDIYMVFVVFLLNVFLHAFLNV